MSVEFVVDRRRENFAPPLDSTTQMAALRVWTYVLPMSPVGTNEQTPMRPVERTLETSGRVALTRLVNQHTDAKRALSGPVDRRG